MKPFSASRASRVCRASLSRRRAGKAPLRPSTCSKRRGSYRKCTSTRAEAGISGTSCREEKRVLAKNGPCLLFELSVFQPKCFFSVVQCSETLWKVGGALDDVATVSDFSIPSFVQTPDLDKATSSHRQTDFIHKKRGQNGEIRG